MNIKLKDIDAVKFNGIDIGAVKFNGKYVWRKGSVIVLNHSAGTFKASAEGTGLKWKYKEQEVTSSSCNFTIDESDDNVYLLFDKELSKFTCNSDNNLLLDLADLGGKITNYLSLYGCKNITGDLSDLGGKITYYLSLSNCKNITGTLSDLNGKITYYLSLSNCKNITGDLSDLSGKITNTLSLYGCSNITGDLSDLGGKITYYLDFYNCTNITGDLSALGGKITYYLSLCGCSNITGDLSDLGGKITDYLNLYGCKNITGIYSGQSYPKTINLSNTGLSASDMDSTLINFANSSVANGTFTANNMTRTSASDEAVSTLKARGWKITGLSKVEA